MRKCLLISLSLVAFAIIGGVIGFNFRRVPWSTHWTRIAPYSAIDWHEPGENPYVLVDGQWYELKAIAGIPIERVQDFAVKEYGGWQLAEKRIAEDIYDVLVAMGVEYPTSVSLKVQRFENGEVVELHRVEMTAEKRSQLYRSRNELEPVAVNLESM